VTEPDALTEFPPSESAALVRRPPRLRWGPWATIAWGIGIAGVMAVGQTVGAAGYLASLRYAHLTLPARGEIGSNGPLLAWAILASTPLVLGAMALAVRLARVRFGEYLALSWPRWRDLGIGLGALTLVLVGAGLAAGLAGEETPDFMLDIFRSARDSGNFALVVFAFVFLAPLQEELLFRGFLYRGLSSSLGAVPTIALTAAVWAVSHLQYDWFFMGEVFAIGLTVGWLRWRSGSTSLTILLHGMMNALALLDVAFLS
jgi:hypothetical protein